MDTQISVPISSSLFLELVDFLRSNGDPRDPVLAVSDAIDYWLANANWKPELLCESGTPGYQWKTLFLPDKTEMRMQYKGKYFYARVMGDQVIYNGNPISPASFVNTVTGTSRNAWRDVWIKRPSDTEWQFANECRSDYVAATDGTRSAGGSAVA